MADETLIGFDAREAGKYDARWDDGRGARFLTQRDVVRPPVIPLEGVRALRIHRRPRHLSRWGDPGGGEAALIRSRVGGRAGMSSQGR